MSSLHGRTSETIAVCVLLVLGVRGKRLLVVVVGFFSPRSKSETLLSSSFILAHRFFWFLSQQQCIIKVSAILFSSISLSSARIPAQNVPVKMQHAFQICRKVH